MPRDMELCTIVYTGVELSYVQADDLTAKMLPRVQASAVFQTFAASQLALTAQVPLCCPGEIKAWNDVPPLSLGGRSLADGIRTSLGDADFAAGKVFFCLPDAHGPFCKGWFLGRP